ncbi:MAG: hypothetical protein J7513_13380 [Solirubrobacteraceae bacterium]|nr:hypothetical protein [Solirubrobacteraceae bacterium]
MARKPTIWQLRWARWRKPLVIVLLVALIGALIVGWYGIAAVLFAVALGIGALGAGPPADNGPTSPPSIPGGTYFGGR